MKKTAPIKGLFLDIGGVLLTNGWEQQSRELAAMVFNLDFTEMNDRHHLAFETYELGKLTLTEYLNLVVFSQERTFSRIEFQNFMFEQSKPYLQMIDLVYQLKAQYQLKIAVVNNEGRELNLYRINHFKLNKLVDFFISSCFVHLRKPDLDMYRMALNFSQIPANQVVYIDDQPMFVQSAESQGIHGIYHTDFASTRRQLAALGLEIAE